MDTQAEECLTDHGNGWEGKTNLQRELLPTNPSAVLEVSCEHLGVLQQRAQGQPNFPLPFSAGERGAPLHRDQARTCTVPRKLDLVHRYFKTALFAVLSGAAVTFDSSSWSANTRGVWLADSSPVSSHKYFAALPVELGLSHVFLIPSHQLLGQMPSLLRAVHEAVPPAIPHNFSQKNSQFGWLWYTAHPPDAPVNHDTYKYAPGVTPNQGTTDKLCPTDRAHGKPPLRPSNSSTDLSVPQKQRRRTDPREHTARAVQHCSSSPLWREPDLLS